MTVYIEKKALGTLKSDCLIVPVFAKNKLGKAAMAFNQEQNGILTKLLKQVTLGEQVGETLLAPLVEHKQIKRVLLLQCGEAKNLDKTVWLKQQSELFAGLKSLAGCHVHCLVDDILSQKLPAEWLGQQVGIAVAAHQYCYETFKSKKTHRPLKKFTLLSGQAPHQKALKLGTTAGNAIGAGMNLTKDLGNAPGNVCTPSHMAKTAQKLANNYKSIKTEIVTEAQMAKLGMNALLAVSKGSVEPPKLVIIKYQGGPAKQAPVVLVGKGVTFDSGGISLKPGAKMDLMKYDMCGAGSVLGTLKAAAELNLPLNVIGVIPTVENMPDGKATKPGDVVTTLSGQTVEILNTDAEGRLILCDALTYAERFKPDTIIDIATLTGAICVALGSHASGLFSHDDALCDEIEKAGLAIHDRVWRLPIWEEYQKDIDGTVADVANMGKPGQAGSIAAACFLARFAKDQRWAHLDVAGSAFPLGSGGNQGASGRPVPLLTQFLVSRCQ